MSDSTNPQSDIGDSKSEWPLWAIYLGISWTWCIGMFLPVLLIRDFGFWSFVVFAAPNVVGAALMGWLLRTADESARFTAAHTKAISVFSGVTACFHGFFLGWISHKMLGRPDLVAAALFASAVAMLILMRRREGAERLLAAAVALASWFIFAWVIRYRVSLGVLLPGVSGGSPIDLLALGSVCVLGFALCPYLDRTFHKARQQLKPRAAKWAFAVGFGGVFFSMILFTLVYSDLIGVKRVTPVITLLLLIHLLIQSAFTVAAHSAAVARPRNVFALLLTAGTCFLAGMYSGRVEYNGMAGGEIGYRLFMSFYGLAASAYVWIVGIRSATKPTAAQWTLLAFVVAVAAPFYWLAFIERQMPWVVVGVGIVLVSRFVITRRPLVA